ncbi:MAG: oxygen-dependent coproporphyrinogen oxidase [Salibacteraceae bacterium]
MADKREEVSNRFKSIQASICKSIEGCDGGGVFTTDEWTRPGGGGGITRVLENAAIIEKGGVNFSAVHGELSGDVARTLNVVGKHFFATGVSIVMHPVNPWVPIIHMNIRYFELDSGDWWFGGGMDLTPHYISQDQAKRFHDQLKQICEQHGMDYAKYAEWARSYFYIPHRGESRGVGGLFFDRLHEQSTGRSFEELFAFVCSVGEQFAPIYTQLINENRNKAWTEAHKAFQLFRRSRYAEFNLIYDKGTRFGLETSGRIDSIFMSLPPLTGWKYAYAFGPEETATIELLRSDYAIR